jgi:perosamine synthetase
MANRVNMVGFNFRLGEIEAAIGREQLRKGKSLIEQRKENVAYLEEKLADYPGLSMPHVGAAGDHVYYVHAMRYDALATGISRDRFIKAIKAELPSTELREGEGPLIGAGYVLPLYLEPMYQEMIAYGSLQCPFRCPLYEGEVSYTKGLCPNAEEAHFETLISHEMIRPPMTRTDLDDVAGAFWKVADNLPRLADATLGEMA